MKAAGNDIMLFSAGENREEGFIFQAYDLEYMDAAKAYRATLSDGRKASNKVLFNSSRRSAMHQRGDAMVAGIGHTGIAK